MDKLTEEGIETATEAQRTLEAAVQMAARDAEKAEVGCILYSNALQDPCACCKQSPD